MIFNVLVNVLNVINVEMFKDCSKQTHQMFNQFLSIYLCSAHEKQFIPKSIIAIIKIYLFMSLNITTYRRIIDR